MNNTDYETDLADLLGELSAVQAELLDVLSEKRDRMVRADLEGMVDIQSREEQLGQRLKDCQQRRSELLARAKQEGLPASDIRELTASLPGGKTGDLEKQAKEASAQSRLLQHHSLTNWVLAQRTLLHLSHLIEIIATGGRLKPTYGGSEAVQSSGALVDQEA